MAARHCATCRVLFPVQNAFNKCPRCKQSTQWDARDPMSAEAFSEFRRTYEPEKFANEQMLVVYRSKQGVRPYAATYDSDETRLQLRRCVERHGSGCGARVVFEPPADPAGLEKL